MGGEPRTRAGEAALRPPQGPRLRTRGMCSALTTIEPDAIAEEVSALGSMGVRAASGPG